MAHSALSTQSRRAETLSTKLHGNAVPEAEFRSRILCAIGRLTMEQQPITWLNLRAAGARGQDRRIRETIEALRREGLIAPHILAAQQGQVTDPITHMEGADLARRRAELVNREAEAREQSAEWIAEHDARWRRIRRKAKGERMKTE